jgi:fumarylacetoacetate (FAA) hydrolase family protein
MLVNQIIPQMGQEGIWIGRCHIPEEKAYHKVEGPHVIWVHQGFVFDLSHYFKSTGELINNPSFRGFLNNDDPHVTKVGTVKEILENSLYHQKDAGKPFFLAPNDTQAVKACGVTFIQSLLERVIEEKANGEPQLALQIRDEITKKIGEGLNKIVPGSPRAMKLKEELKNRGIWSQYLEVGIGPDAVV